MSDQEQANDLEDIRASLGSQLRAAREHNHFSVEQVASHLMLDRHVIEGLEAGDYSGLPEITFIRGYLQSYLRLVGKPETLLEQFDASNRHEHPVVLERPSVARSSCSDDGWVRCISAGLVVLLFVAVGLWFGEQSWRVLETVQPESLLTFGDSAQTDDQEYAAATDAEPLAESNVDGDVTADPEVKVIESAEPEKVKEIDVAEEVSGSPEAQEQLPGDKHNELILRFTGSSWIRIVDAKGIKLVAGTYYNNQEVVLHGELPYSVILGNAGFVKLWFRGTAIEKEYQPGKVARFTLGEQEQ